jgi:hypothetical protein
MRINHQPILQRSSFLLKIVLTFFLYSSSNTYLAAQESNFDKVVKAFRDYSKAYREVVYCHLNKSTYIKGEHLGFSTYVVDKDLKTLSKTTKNLYCVILDSTNTIIKSKLIKVNNGVSHNIFNLDSLFTSGNYMFKAYTNWMNNFDEPNAFIETFRVIDPKIEDLIKRLGIENTIDAQFLPEGGHFVDNVLANVGVVIKNEEGFGLASVQGNIYDNANKFITSFETNSFGIGRFLITPQLNQSYKVKINHLNKAFEFKIDNIIPKGIAIHVNKLKGKLAIEFRTNERTLKDINEEPFKLLLTNGKSIKEVSLKFLEKNLLKLIDYDELFSGINILTLFNKENKPILERLFFNYDNINIINTSNPRYIKLGDSLKISIPFEKPFEASEENINLSISVLPKESKSYKRHQNIISYGYLQPYIKGYIENAAYYFTDINNKKEFELDNLLITQGWSAYNWNNIFNRATTNNFVFEDGIVIKMNNNNEEATSYIIYPMENNKGYIIDFPKNEKSFIKAGFYPVEDETLNLSVLNTKQKLRKANLYIQFLPSKIPELNNFGVTLPKPSTFTYTKTNQNGGFRLINLDKLQELDEIVLNTKLRQTKINNLKVSSSSKVYVFDNAMRTMNLTLANYINANIPGFNASEQMGVFNISGANTTSFVNQDRTPLVYLDDVLLNNLEFLINFDMSRVDYIVVNRHGFGEGVRGSNGVFKIYTSNVFDDARSVETYRKFEFPLTFSETKKFYVPKYEVYNDDFFKEYGVISWIPNGKIDRNGNLTFTVYNPSNNNIKLFIEGITQQGSYLAEIKVIDINNN